MSSLSALEKARIAAEAALDRKATDPVILDVREVTSFADAFVVLTGRSDRQVKAIADAVQEALRAHGEKPLGVEGIEDGHWVLMDCNDLIVHVFQEETREHYDLERLWSDAPRVEVAGAPSPTPTQQAH